jgi:hypothetical protein
MLPSFRVRRLVLLGFLLPALAAAAPPQIWFCPMDPLLRPEVGYGGSPHYMDLFRPDAPWTRATSRVAVFKIYPQWIAGATDADLRRQFADLQRRGIALALEAGVLTRVGDLGLGVEGFGGDGLLPMVQRIQRDGGTLRYVAMDEPLFFGTVSTRSHAPRWTPQQAVDNAAVNIRAVRAEFPGVQFGDIEPVGASPLPDELRNYRDGWRAFAAAGLPLAFFDADLAWQKPDVMTHLTAVRQAAREQGLPFGLIVNGNPHDPTDAAWLESARQHLAQAVAAIGPPDALIFQSWHARPDKLLPETDPDAFTNLIDTAPAP